jgi:hypothetical protein
MSLAEVIQDPAMLVPGHEHHTWRCSHCSRVEKRMTFTRAPTQVSPSEAPGTVSVAAEAMQVAAEAKQTVPGDLTPMGMLQLVGRCQARQAAPRSYDRRERH